MPPTILPYNGPVLTMYPSGAGTQVFAEFGVGGSVTNADNFAGLDNLKATFTQNMGTSGNGPTIRYAYVAPPELQSARIRAWKPIARRVRVTAVGGSPAKGDPQFTIRAVNSSLNAIGQAFGWHEFPVDGSTTESFTIQDEYSFGEIGSGASIYPDGYFQFAGGSTAAGLSALTFATFHGLWVSTNTGGLGSSLTSQSFEIDTVQLDVAYTPPNPGTTVRALTVNSETVASVTAASLGVTTDPDWGSEIDWSNPGNAQTQNTTFAEAAIVSDGVTPTKFAQTRFLRGRISSGGVGSTVGLVGKELRIPVVAACSGAQDGLNGISTVPITPDQWSFASVAEALVLDLDGNILARLSDNPLYGITTFKIGASGQALTALQRVYDVCIDISALTPAQLADMDARGFRFAIRFNLYAGLNTALDEVPVLLHVNSFTRTGDTPTISFVPATLPTLRGRGFGEASSGAFRNRISA